MQRRVGCTKPGGEQLEDVEDEFGRVVGQAVDWDWTDVVHVTACKFGAVRYITCDPWYAYTPLRHGVPSPNHRILTDSLRFYKLTSSHVFHLPVH